jgi:hypothetical protein
MKKGGEQNIRSFARFRLIFLFSAKEGRVWGGVPDEIGYLFGMHRILSWKGVRTNSVFVRDVLQNEEDTLLYNGNDCAYMVMNPIGAEIVQRMYPERVVLIPYEEVCNDTLQQLVECIHFIITITELEKV